MIENLLSNSAELTSLEEELLDWVLERGVYHPLGIHGITHWGRVRAYGLALVPLTGADPQIVSLFALLHDVCRVNDVHDPQHGPRAAKLAATLREQFIPLEDHKFDLLTTALKHHTSGTTSTDPDIGTCWDADRLDLPRVHTRVRCRFLSNDAAKNPEMILSATKAACSGDCPDFMQRILTRYE